MHIRTPSSSLHALIPPQKPALSTWQVGAMVLTDGAWALRRAGEASGRPGGAGPALRRRVVPQVVPRTHVQELLPAELPEQDRGP
jgi:hypothetical protein